VQAYIASQLLLFSILYIPFNAAIDPSDLVDIPWWLILLLYVWDYKQLFRNSWLRTLLLTVQMIALCILFIVLAATTTAAVLFLIGSTPA
jgi:hypothetical protein